MGRNGPAQRYCKGIKLNVEVYSHQRSGTHYLAALISKNFFGKTHYKSLIPKHVHATPRKGKWEPPHGTFKLYIYRNQNDVLYSIWKMRKVFGLTTETYNDFVVTPYNLQSKRRREPLAERDFAVINLRTELQIQKTNLVSFANCISVPQERHRVHLKRWRERTNTRDDILMVKYEDLKSNFDRTMFNIAKFLKLDVQPFVDIKEKVGWYVP